MINQEILSYIRAQVANGVSREDIIKALATGGWSKQDAQEAFDSIDGKQPATPPPAPKAPPVSTATARTNIGIGEAARMAQGGPQQPPAPAQQPMRAAPLMGPQPVAPRLTIDTRPVGQPVPRMAPMATKRRRRTPWALILILLLLALGAAGAYLYYPQLLKLFNDTVTSFFPTYSTTPEEDFPITEWDGSVDTSLSSTTTSGVGESTASSTKSEDAEAMMEGEETGGVDIPASL